jgi:hypothetical protein
MDKIEFLRNYIHYGSIRVSEFSGNSQEDYKSLVEEARQGAKFLDIDWDDSFIPAHVWDCVNNYGLDN